MAIAMSKNLLVRLPESLYQRLKKVCASEYKSMSAFIRDLLKERFEETLSAEDIKDIDMARHELKSGKAVSWRYHKCSKFK